jgi:putative ABC transport system permease protein
MIRQSARLGFRRFVRDPGITSITFATLAIGIGVSAMIFAVAWTILIRPFPFRNQDRLAVLWVNDPKGDVPKLEVTFEQIERLQKDGRTIAGLAGVSAANFPVLVKRGEQPIHLMANMVGEPFFRILGVGAARGRTFRRDEHRVGAPAVAMLSWEAWRDRFGEDPAVIGSRLKSGQDSVQIVGVLPRHLNLPAAAEIIFPMELGMTDDNIRTNHILSAIVLMKPDVTLQQLAAETAVISDQLRREHPERREEGTIIPYAITDEILGPARRAVKIMFAMGALVLVISLINVVSIALAMGVRRLDELAVRAATGGTARRRALELFVEFSVPALAAALAGFLFARLLLGILLAIAPTTIPRIGEVHVGWEAFLFAVAAALLAALASALVQVALRRDEDLLRSLRGAAKSTAGRAARRMLEVLAAAQIAVAIVTIVVAALLIQSFRRYASIDVGFNRQNVLTFHLPRGYVMSDAPEKHHAFFATLLDRIRAIDGVEAAGSVLMRPLEVEQGWDFTFTVEGQSIAEQERNPLSNFLDCTPGYFEAMGIAPVAGRTFTTADTPQSEKVAVVGEAFARRFWGSPTAALGKRVKSGHPDSDKPWVKVVGVVRDVRSRGLTTEKLDFWVPHTQSIWSPNYVAVRTRQNPEAILPNIRAIVAQLDKEIPVASVRTSRELVDAKLAQPRLSAAIVTTFAITAGVLALIGLYGVLAYGVRQRMAELGIRVAVGASERDLLTLVIRRALVLAVCGTAAGAAISVVADRFWRGYVYGAGSVDPRLISILAVLFALAALAASAIPAARAAKIDPSVALRAE